MGTRLDMPTVAAICVITTMPTIMNSSRSWNGTLPSVPSKAEASEMMQKQQGIFRKESERRHQAIADRV
ncbi:hypothetical protein G7Y79_00004g014220 [Physcia stellaris]|nr:hypothetical protein G7Y79_00004g014220 [Physcia stellaris]